MKATKILSAGALAAALTLGGLSVRGYAADQANTQADTHKSMQGEEHKCGSGNCGAANCGASKADDQKAKQASDKPADATQAKDKGASHSCGAAKCG